MQGKEMVWPFEAVLVPSTGDMTSLSFNICIPQKHTKNGSIFRVYYIVFPTIQLFSTTVHSLYVYKIFGQNIPIPWWFIPNGLLWKENMIRPLIATRNIQVRASHFKNVLRSKFSVILRIGRVLTRHYLHSHHYSNALHGSFVLPQTFHADENHRFSEYKSPYYEREFGLDTYGRKDEQKSFPNKRHQEYSATLNVG